MSETSALPTIKRFAFTNTLSSTTKSQTPGKNNELPKSVTDKLKFLKEHKDDIQRNALKDFITKKSSSLSDNERARNQRNSSELTKVVSKRTASLVDTSAPTKISLVRLSNSALNNVADSSDQFDRKMEDLDFDEVFGDDDYVASTQRNKIKNDNNSIQSSKQKTNVINNRQNNKLSLNSNNREQNNSTTTSTLTSNHKKKFVFGRVANTKVYHNVFTGERLNESVKCETNSEYLTSLSTKPVDTENKNNLRSRLLQSNINYSSASNDGIKSASSSSRSIPANPQTSERTEFKNEIKAESQVTDEYNEFMLSNVDWDNEDDWSNQDADLDSKNFKTEVDADPDTTIIYNVPDEPKKPNNSSVITADDYVDDDFDFSQLGVEENKNQLDLSGLKAEDEYADLGLAFEDDFDVPSTSTCNFNSSINMMNNDPCSSSSPIVKEPGFVAIDKDAKTRKDDTAQFQKEYPHSVVLREILHEKFGLKEFRPNQQEIINASLELYDCFVLMPTGGGKSLCYQLPAILTPGVTIVISPLRALIVDQVNKLNSLDIPAAHMCADLSKEEHSNVMRSLTRLEPSIKLLYLTPEKIIGSRVTFDLLLGLYKRGKLARIVLDEAHCLSQWGHDFRPDYKQLATLKSNFPKTPIMCLTATATNVVQQDVINILKLRQVKTFIRSFNRSNIKYAVLEKGRTSMATAEIVKLLQQNFRKMSGIVYCLVRKECDALAMDLRKQGIKAKSYHAGLASKQREEVQAQWMNNEYHVICATIAFGMGIDKPDVRFVIHNSMPKSLESFYQESGRGGRDGEIAYSYLFYAYGDVVRLQRLVRMDKSIPRRNLEGHFDQIAQMAQYCENRIDCRRYLQLLHLGEKFNRQLCIQDRKTICDNCLNYGKITLQNVAKESREIAQLVRDIGLKRNFTMLHYVDVYRGSKIKKIMDFKHNTHKYFGSGSHLSKSDVHRIMKELSFKKVLKDFCEYSGEYPIIYIQPGPNYEHLFNKDVVLTIPLTSKGKKATPIEDIPEGPDFIDCPSSPEPANAKPSTSKTVVAKTAVTSPFKSPEKRIRSLQVKCHEELLEKCAEFAATKQTNLSSIMNLSAIKNMSEEMPGNVEAFMKIQYVTKANFEKFGKDFLEITKKYRQQVDVVEAECALNDLDASAFDDDWGAASNTSFQSPSRNTSYRGGIKRKFVRYRSKRGTTKRRKK